MNNKLKNTMELVSTDLLSKISGGMDLFANNSSHRMPTISGYANMAPQGQVNYNVTVSVPIPYVDHISAIGSFQGTNNIVHSTGIGIGFNVDLN